MNKIIIVICSGLHAEETSSAVQISLSRFFEDEQQKKIICKNHVNFINYKPIN
jgi:hypothetical protein